MKTVTESESESRATGLVLVFNRTRERPVLSLMACGGRPVEASYHL